MPLPTTQAKDSTVRQPEVITRIPELDGTRGLAVGFVILSHYANFGDFVHKGLSYYLSLSTHLMWSGVDLFFVLSGFLIGGILVDNRPSKNYYSSFYARRIYRIFPVYYFMVGALIIGASLFPKSPLFTGQIPFWCFLVYAQNLVGDWTRAPLWIGVSWSLAVEEQFYLLFPFVVKRLTKRNLLILMAACIVGAPALRTLLILHGFAFEYVHALLPCRADALAFGVVAAMVVRSDKAKSWIRHHARGLYLAFLACCACLPTMLKWTTYKFVGTVGYSMLGVTYVLLILLLLLAPKPSMRAFFQASWLRRLGTISYCLYLIHQPVRTGLFLLFGLGPKPMIVGTLSLLATIAALGLSVALAQGSWILIEQKLIRRAHLRYQY